MWGYWTCIVEKATVRFVTHPVSDLQSQHIDTKQVEQASTGKKHDRIATITYISCTSSCVKLTQAVFHLFPEAARHNLGQKTWLWGWLHPPHMAQYYFWYIHALSCCSYVCCRYIFNLWNYFCTQRVRHLQLIKELNKNQGVCIRECTKF